METNFLWFGVFSASFGIRSIVLCKCSGKYIDIYFKLKITCFESLSSLMSFIGHEQCIEPLGFA